MSTREVSTAIVKVVEKITNGQIAGIDEAVLDSIGDAEHYVMQAFNAQLRRDNLAVVRNLRDAQMSNGMNTLQLSLPGLEHATLPAIVLDLGSPPDKPRLKPVQSATIVEIRSEIKGMRRTVNARERVVAGYEATLAAIEETLDPSDDTTGFEIEAQLRAITA